MSAGTPSSPVELHPFLSLVERANFNAGRKRKNKRCPPGPRHLPQCMHAELRRENASREIFPSVPIKENDAVAPEFAW